MSRHSFCASIALLLSACGGGGADDGAAPPAASTVAPAAKTVFQAAARDEAIVAAGHDVQLSLANVGGAPAISQIGGAPLGTLTLNGSQLSFHAPDMAAAGIAELQLSSVDANGRRSESVIRVLVGPTSDSGRLLTLIGSPDSAGLHWIITGDGFTESQQDDLRRAALAMGRALLATPELTQHAGIWNVHVLSAASHASGVDTASASVDTAFDGTIACTAVARVACVDWHKVQNAVLAERAPRAWLAVIVNSPEYIGTSGPNGFITSRHSAAAALAMHEMGHQVAGLADEYVDPVTAQDLLPLYVEGRYANVTTHVDPSLVPWRHWLGTPGTDIGLHEGAYYTAAGFYRPKSDSLMRTLSAPLGEVNAEAWLRAQYREVPPVISASPQSAQVRGLSGDTLDFEIVSPWPRSVVDWRWFLDDVEVASARHLARYRFVTDGLVHRVRVEAGDVSGRIRAPGATESRFSRSWTVSPDPVPMEKAGLTPLQARQWLQMRVDASGHSLLARIPDGVAMPRLTTRSARTDWQYSLLDDAGQVIAQGALDDPRRVYGPLPLPGESSAGHELAVLPAGHYLIGIPQGAAARKMRLAPSVATLRKTNSGSLPGAIEIDLDAS